MRILGLALVLGGYLWLVWDQFSFGPMARVAMDKSATTEVLLHRSAHPVPLASLPDTVYSLRNDAAKGLPYVGVRELRRLLPNFLWSGTTMLVGGLLLARESSRRKPVKTAAQTDAKPQPGS